MSKPKAPKGFVLTRHEGYWLDQRGFRVDKPDEHVLMNDGVIGVAWFNEEEPFVAATSPEGEEGYSPNVQVLPITDGWVPPVYTLHTKEEAP